MEISARTVEEAIQSALTQLGVSREEVNITVLKEGKSGILGLGSEEATIRIDPLVTIPDTNVDDIAKAAKDVLGTLLTMIGVTGSVVPHEEPFAPWEETAPVALDIEGDDLGILIGRRGQTLACLQYIVRLIIGHQTQAWLPIIIDVEGYKQRHYEALQTLAHHMGEHVKTKRVPFTLEPMPAYERRIIHLSLAEHPDVTTQSTGEGEMRKVVILPKKK
ncbi:RNA-binding cell elongation regulator Jag/EloR [Chloroflexota bacterium]